MQQGVRSSWFVRGDLDGFFGLFVDNVLQLMLIAILCQHVCGLPPELVTGRILPGAAISILLGNLFYAWQARQLALQTGRSDVTALPYGINTPSLLAYVFFIMAPIYHETKDPMLAWQAGLFACFLSGVMEVAGAYVGDWLRRNTPRAALLCALAGVAITFIAMGFIFQMFASPLIAIVPLILILGTYAARVKLPLGLPGGFLAVVIGTALAWFLRGIGFPSFEPVQDAYTFAVHTPKPYFSDLFALLNSPRGWSYMAVIFPMGLFNIIGSLQNLESAEAAGDSYKTKPSLLANGIGSLTAAVFGSPFPTTIYIGHPAWKSMGARYGYSVLNGAVITLLCLIGGITLALKVIPLEATLGILLWIGIVITAQAFQEVPKSHAIAVAMGFIPCLAAWGLYLIETTARVAGSSLFELSSKFGTDLYIHGIIALNQGFLLSSMLFAAVLVFIVEREFKRAAAWLLVAAVLSFTGVIHAYQLTPFGIQNKFGWWAAPAFGLAYAASAALLFIFHLRKPRA